MSTGKDYVEWLKDRLMANEITTRKPDLIDAGWSKHVKRNAVLTVIVVLVLGVINGICMYFWPGLWDADPKLLIRWTVEKLQHMTLFGLCLMIWVEYMDGKSNGNFVGSIIQSPMACAVFLGLLALSGAVVFIYV